MSHGSPHRLVRPGLDPRGPVVGLALLIIALYQRLRPASMRGHCRYRPTCSDYARESILRHGLWRGLSLAMRRVVRCHPLGASGWDPVP